MANTTSGTVTFDKGFAVDDIIAEAYERIGSQVTSGYQLRSARRSLNILFKNGAIEVCIIGKWETLILILLKAK